MSASTLRPVSLAFCGLHRCLHGCLRACVHRREHERRNEGVRGRLKMGALEAP